MTSREKIKRFLEDYEEVNVIISDLHLGARRPRTINGEPLEEHYFIKRLMDFFKGVDNFVFLGDTIDLSEGNTRIVSDSAGILFSELKKRGKFYNTIFIKGNHDFEFGFLVKKEPVLVERRARFVFPACHVLMLHGDDIGLEGSKGSTQTYVEMKKKLVRNVRFDLRQRDWLIFGHAHIPGISLEERVCGLGSWDGELADRENELLKRRFALITVGRKNLPRLEVQEGQEQLVRIRDIPYQWFQ